MMRRLHCKAACAGLLLAMGAVVLPVRAEGPPLAEKELRRFIQKSMNAHEVTGLSVAIYDESGVRWAEGFGWENRNQRIAATPATLYRIGSLTKPFTGMAILQLVEEGKIDLDASLLHYLPDLRLEITEGSDPPTVRSILMHLSGLPSNHLNGMWGAGKPSREEFFESLRGEALAAPVDYVPSYSNLGFSLLGYVIEAVSGQPYEAYVEDHLFGPMGMSSSAVTDIHESRVSRAYLDGKEITDAALRDVAAGGINSSVLDMAALAEVVLHQGAVGGRRILQPETWKQMIAPQATSSPFTFGRELAMVWGRRPFEIDKAGPMIGHDGGTGLFFSLFLCIPEQKICALTLSNSRGGAAAQTEITRGLLLAALEEKTGWTPAEREAPSLRRVKLEPDDLVNLSGTFVTEAGLLRLESKGSKLSGEIEGTKLEMIRMSDGFLHPRIRAVGFLRVTVDEIALTLEKVAGRSVLLQHQDGRRALFGEKVMPRVLAGAWAHREGSYRVTNAKSDFQMSDLVIERRRGFLEASYSGVWPGTTERNTVRMILLPETDTEAVVAGLGRGTGDRVRFVADPQGELMIYSGFRFRKRPE
ncbi:MAG: beta-lactamase family protein [Thermoanaerobaculia bacterium]|nr:beta-lactamase family protein [Thermoanaerobaculia bacterium]